jgi:hypothetical protein
MHSVMLYTYNKHRTKDLHEDNSQGFEDIKPESSGFNNPMGGGIDVCACGHLPPHR